MSSVDTCASSVDTWMIKCRLPEIKCRHLTAKCRHLQPDSSNGSIFLACRNGFSSSKRLFPMLQRSQTIFRRFLVYLISTNLILKQEKWREVKRKKREVYSRAFKSTQKPISQYSLQTSNQKPLQAWFHWKSLLAQLYYIPKGGNLKKSEVKASFGLQRFQSTLEESLL